MSLSPQSPHPGEQGLGLVPPGEGCRVPRGSEWTHPTPSHHCSRALGQGGLAEGRGLWVGWEVCPAWPRSHPLPQALLRASLRRLSRPYPWYEGAPRRCLLSPHQHTEAWASGHILCQHGPLAQLPAPGSHAHCTGDRCPKHLLHGLLPGGTSLPYGSMRPEVFGHSCPFSGAWVPTSLHLHTDHPSWASCTGGAQL